MFNFIMDFQCIWSGVT